MDSNLLSQGVMLTIVGLTTVFFFLTFISIVVYILKKTVKKKDISININVAIKPQSDLKKLEKIAIISAAYHFIQNKHSSIAEDFQKSNLNIFNWINTRN